MIKSVEKALRILNYIAESPSEPVTLSAIAQGLQMNAATCSHLVNTLCDCQYLERVSRSEGYAMGPMAYSIASGRVYKGELIRVAAPYMMRLCRDLKENVSMSTYAQGHLFVPYTINYRETHVERRGTLRGRLYQSASGRVILAYMENREREALVQNLGYPVADEWAEAACPRDMLSALTEIRRAGFCLAHRVRDSLSAVACPIVENRAVRAAVGVNMEYTRFTGPHLCEAVALTQKTAALITRRMSE